MFEIGFSEILLILVIALVVVGPQKLPRIATQVGRWAGRARNVARQFREQLESEVDLERATSWAEDKGKKAAGTSPPPVDSAPQTPAAADTPPPTETATGYAPYSGEYPPDSPVPADDTYSHAHAAGEVQDAPLPTDAGADLPHNAQADWVTPAAAPAAADTPERLHEDHRR